MMGLVLLLPNTPSSAEFLFKPLFLIIDAPKGKATGSVTISNPFEKPARLQLSLSEWQVNDKGGFDIVENGDEGFKGVAKNVRITPRQFTIKPNETKTVRIATRIPSDYADGEYRLFLNMLEIGADRKDIANVGNADQAFGLVINKQFRAGTYIRKGKPSALNSNLDVLDVKPIQKENRVVKYHLQYTNTGNIHVRKDIGARFYDGSGKLVHEVPFSGVLIAFPTNDNVPLITATKSIRIPDELEANQDYEVELILVDSIEDESSRSQNNPVIVTKKFKL